jgi:phosphatidate cytidylyltransferase
MLRRIILFVDIRLLLYVSLLLMFCFMITGIGKYTVADLSVTILGAFYICFLFWYMIMLRNLRFGEYAIWFVAIGAVATDTGAFVTGKLIGRRKLIPRVSANKTVEGAIGGAIACVLVITLYGALFFNKMAYESPAWQYVLMGLACGVVAQIGDLAASCIKRYCGIKDFGKIIPGHGGILDRMDSAILISPLIYIIMTVMEKV